MARFPLEPHVADSRFGFGVTAQVAKILALHNFPNIMSFYAGAEMDFNRLQEVLRGFIYGHLGADTAAEVTQDHPLTLAASVSGLAEAEIPSAPTVPLGDLVEFRVIGTRERAEKAADVLALLFTLTHITDTLPARDGRFRIYLTGFAPHAYDGGTP